MPSRHALVLLLLLLLPLCVAPEPAAELSENKTPDVGDINTTWTPEALTLTFGASVLGTLPLGIGRTALTLLSEPLVLPQARANVPRLLPRLASASGTRIGAFLRTRRVSALFAYAPPGIQRA